MGGGVGSVWGVAGPGLCARARVGGGARARLGPGARARWRMGVRVGLPRGGKLGTGDLWVYVVSQPPMITTSDANMGHSREGGAQTAGGGRGGGVALAACQGPAPPNPFGGGLRSWSYPFCGSCALRAPPTKRRLPQPPPFAVASPGAASVRPDTHDGRRRSHSLMACRSAARARPPQCPATRRRTRSATATLSRFQATHAGKYWNGCAPQDEGGGGTPPGPLPPRPKGPSWDKTECTVGEL